MKKSPYIWLCGNSRNKGFFIYSQIALKAALYKALRAFLILELSLSYQEKESKDHADAKNVPANENFSSWAEPSKLSICWHIDSPGGGTWEAI